MKLRNLVSLCTAAVLTVLVPSAAAQMDSAALLLALPECAQTCTLVALTAGACDLFNLTALSNCACTSVPLSANLSACVQTSCVWNDQMKASSQFQSLCNGFPHESRRSEVYATAMACLVLPLIFVALRCFARFVVTNRLWWDDWTTLIATVFLIGICSCYIVATQLGFGLHIWNVSPPNTPTILQLFYASQILYILIQVSAKVSILILYWRIFPTRWFRVTVWCSVAWLVSHGFIFCGLIIFQCRPLYGAWDQSIESQCINITAVGWAGGSFAIFEDIVILLLPIPEVKKLQLTVQKKIAVYLMFAIGSFACVTSAVRLKYLGGFGHSLDATWDNSDVVIWSIMELSVAIICASLPALRPLLAKVPGFISTNRSKNSKSDPSAKSGIAASTNNTAFSKRRPSNPLSVSRGYVEAPDERDVAPFARRGEYSPHIDETELSIIEKGQRG